MFGEKSQGRTVQLPGNWSDLLRDPNSKQELFAFLSKKIGTVNCPNHKEVIITFGDTTVLRGTNWSMASCDHEEAVDPCTRYSSEWLYQLSGAHCWHGCRVAILIGKFHNLITLWQDVNIWVAFGTGKNLTHRYYHINTIYDYSGRAKYLALTVFHSFTGCDTRSLFFGKGKRSAWEARLFYQDVTYAFIRISLYLYTDVKVNAQDFQLLEGFRVVLYEKAWNMWMKPGRSSFAKRVKQCRHSPNSGCIIAALQTSCIPEWNMVHQCPEWVACP